MGYGKTLRERIPAIRFLVEAQKTVWYPVLFAVICIISGSYDRRVYIPLILILCSFVLFSILFTDDNKVFLVPMMMIYYCIGRDNTDAKPGVEDDLLTSSFDMGGFTFIIVCGSVLVAAFIARLIADGSFARAIKRRRIGSYGILAMVAALMLNGAFSPDYTPMNILYGFIIAVTFTLFYFATAGMLEGSRDVIPYACRAMVATSYVALGQFALLVLKLWQSGRLFTVYSPEIATINRHLFVLSWGLSTAIGAVFVLGIAASLYLARNGKLAPLSYLSAILFLAGTVFINTRSAMLVGAAALLAGAAACCFGNRQHRANVIFCRIAFALIVIAGGVLIYRLSLSEDIFDKILKLLRLNSDYDNSSRLKLWTRGLEDFLRLPVFGAGFDTGNISNNVFSSMYHCIIVEFLGAMGIVGLWAFIMHLFTMGKIFFSRPSVNKFLLLLLPLMIIGMSLVDNFFFYPNFQIFYCIFLVLAEYYEDHKQNEGDCESIQAPQSSISRNYISKSIDTPGFL